MVSADSVAGGGGTFTVVVPFGTAHLDPERIGNVSKLASPGVMPSAFVEEALGCRMTTRRSPGVTWLQRHLRGSGSTRKFLLLKELSWRFPSRHATFRLYQLLPARV